MPLSQYGTNGYYTSDGTAEEAAANAAGGSNNVAGAGASDPSGVNLQNLWGSGDQVVGPDANAYNKVRNNFQSSQDDFTGMANDATQRTAPDASNPYAAQSQAGLASAYGSQNGLADNLQGIINANGYSAPIDNQFNRALSQSQDAQTALGNSARGGSMGLAAGGRMAQENNAQTQAGSTAQLQALHAQSLANAQSQLGQLTGQQGQLQLGQYNLENQGAIQNAQLQQNQTGQNEAYANGLNSLALASQQASYGALDAYTKQNLAAQGAQTVNDAQASQYGAAALNGASSAIAQGAKSNGGGAGGGGGGGGDSGPAYDSSSGYSPEQVDSRAGPGAEWDTPNGS